MKFLYFALALAPAAVLAQATASIPACALTCVTASFAGTSCSSIANVTCLCTDTGYQAAFLACQMRTCTAAELNAAVAFGAAQCSAIGITLPPLPSNASSSANATSSAASSAATTASVTATGASSAARSSAATGASSVTSTAAPAATSARSDAHKLVGGIAGSLVLGLALLV